MNNLPSLHINTIDAAVNRPMIAELLNIVGLTIPRSIVNKHAKSIAKDRDGNRIIELLYLLSYTDNELTNSLLLAFNWLTILAISVCDLV